MTRKRLVVEMGRGNDLQGRDYTKAAVRALRDALHRNSLTVAPALGYPREAMEVDISIGVARPGEVDRDAVRAVLPYGRGSVEVVKGGLDVPADEGDGVTVVANAAAVVWLDIDDASPGQVTSQVTGQVTGRVTGRVTGQVTSQVTSQVTGQVAGEAEDPRAGRDDGKRDGATTIVGAQTDGDPADERLPAPRRLILETGVGADLRGEDVTKAARRAVRDALHHSSLALFGSLGIPAASMHVEIRIGVQRPEEVDLEAVASEVPYGAVTASAEIGGLDIPYDELGTRIIVASAAIIARLRLPDGRYTIGG